jgi:hypothetical protein
VSNGYARQVEAPELAMLPSPHLFGDVVASTLLQQQRPDLVSVFSREPLAPDEIRRRFPRIRGRQLEVVSTRPFLLNVDFWIITGDDELETLHPDVVITRTLRLVAGTSLEDPLRVLHFAWRFAWDALEIDTRALLRACLDRVRLDPEQSELDALSLGYASAEQLVNSAGAQVRGL